MRTSFSKVGLRRVAGITVGALVLVGLVALALLLQAGSASGQGAPPRLSGTTLLRELPERRSEDSMTYLTADGSFTTRFFSGPVNFKDRDGEWRAIDDDLEPVAGGYANKANRFRLLAPDSLARPVRVSDGGAWVEYRLVGADAPVAVDGSAARYRGALKGVDAEYRADGGTVKETLTLAGPDSARVFRFRVRASAGLVAKERPDRSIALVDEAGDVRFLFASPVMWDSSRGPTAASSKIRRGTRPGGGRLHGRTHPGFEVARR